MTGQNKREFDLLRSFR